MLLTRPTRCFTISFRRFTFLKNENMRKPDKRSVPLPAIQTVAPPSSDPANGSATPPTPSAPVDGHTSPFSFSVVSLTEVPKHIPGNGQVSKYKAIETALKSLEAGKSLAVQVPPGMDPKEMYAGMLTSLRRNLPETRSKTTKNVIYLWLDKEAHRRLKEKRTGVATTPARPFVDGKERTV